MPTAAFNRIAFNAVSFNGARPRASGGSATSYATSGAAWSMAGYPSQPVVLTPDGTVASDTVTPSDGGHGGTFTPASLTFSASSSPQSVAYTNAIPGDYTLTFASAAALAVAPLAFAVYASTAYQSFVAGMPAGFAGSAVVTPQVMGWSGLSTPGSSLVGAAAPTALGGSYWCPVVYRTVDLPAGSVASVEWAVDGAIAIDHAPILATQGGGLPANFAALAVDPATGGVRLSPTGLDAIPVTDPGGVAGMTTLPAMIVALWRYTYRRSTLTATRITTYADDGATANTSQAVSDTGTVQTRGAAT